MEYKVGDWVKVKYTGQHCHGYDHSKPFMELQIILYKENILIETDNTIKKGHHPDSRWISFRDREGHPVLFSVNKTDYILGLINLEYEIY